MAGCGGEDRSALPRTTGKTYWKDIGDMKLGDSYKMMTPGNRSQTSQAEYAQNMMGLIKQTSGLTAAVGAPKVDGDSARVPVTLHSPLTTQPKRACQHLY